MQTSVNTQQIRSGAVCRTNLNTTISGKALFTKLLVPANNPGVILLSSTGADAGTGDVTIDLNYSYLNTLYASQAWVIAQHYLDSYTESDPVFVSSIAHNITAANINCWNNACTKFPKSISVSGAVSKMITLTLNDDSTLSAGFTDLSGDGEGGSIPTFDQVTSTGNTTDNSIKVGNLTASTMAGGIDNSQYLSTDGSGLLQLSPLHWIQDVALGFSRLSPNIGEIIDLRGKGIIESSFIPLNNPGPVYIVGVKDYNIINVIPGLTMNICLPSAAEYPGRLLKIRAAAQSCRIVFTDAAAKSVNTVVLQVQGSGNYQYVVGLSESGGAFPNEWVEIISVDLSGTGDCYWLVNQYK